MSGMLDWDDEEGAINAAHSTPIICATCGKDHSRYLSITVPVEVGDVRNIVLGLWQAWWGVWARHPEPFGKRLAGSLADG